MTPGWVLQGALLCFLGAHSVTAAVPERWHIRPASTSNHLHGVAYGDGLFVAAGNQTTILTSSNGIEWVPRSAGTTGPTLFCAAATYRPWYVAGEGLIRHSYDGVNWTDGLSTTAPEAIFSLVGSLLAVGRDHSANRTYVLYSGNRFWETNAVPTTNSLFAISWRKERHGQITPSVPFVAVGDGGTIVLSTNGVDWTLQESGTSLALRSAVYHDGRIIAGGDRGVLLTSFDGVSWTPSPPLSFDIRALASSGNAVVAVGKQENTGRIQVSADGVNWLEQPVEFPRPLNAVTHGQSSFLAAGDSGLIVQSEYAPDASVNAWTKPTSGFWEEEFWSCGRLPAPDQGTIALTNAGSKSVEIGQTTTANFSNALSLFAVNIDAPAGSSNQILLNNAGTNVPLDVLFFTVGTNASLASHASAVKAYDLDIYGSALVAESSSLIVNRIRLLGNLILSNSYSRVGFLPVYPNGALTHVSGISELPRTVLDGGSIFVLQGGNVSMRELFLKYPVGSGTDYGTKAAGVATFVQHGGDLSTDLIRFGTPNSNHRGEFFLHRGSLRSQRVEFMNGTFTQAGGTNTAGTIEMPSYQFGLGGRYSLVAGNLVSDSLTVGNYGWNWPIDRNLGHFVQSGGIHDAGSVSLNGYITHAGRSMDQTAIHVGFYSLSNGMLRSRGLSVRGGFTQNGGTNLAGALGIYDGGTYVLSDGELATSNTFVCGFIAGAYSCSGSGGLMQRGGRHSIENALSVGTYGGYQLEEGLLVAPRITVHAHASIRCTRGVISNEGIFTMVGGAFVPGNGPHRLGQLELVENEQEITPWPCRAPTNSLVLSRSTNAHDVQFVDSSDVSWSGAIKIIGWAPDSSPRLFFGTNSEGLSEAQLLKVIFVNPAGWRPGEYAAHILDTGEVVPAMRPLLGMTRDPRGLALSWPGEYDLFSATNLHGPFLKVDAAENRATNQFNAPQQFFQLRRRSE
jgi:hypothetical protein